MTPLLETSLRANTTPTAFFTPGRSAISATREADMGIAPRNGPDAPLLTTQALALKVSTVRLASAPNPLLIPVITRAIPSTSAVPIVAMANRRRRHCKSRSADLSIGCPAHPPWQSTPYEKQSFARTLPDRWSDRKAFGTIRTKGASSPRHHVRVASNSR